MPLTVEQGEKIVEEFCATYPGATQVLFKLRKTQEELYGPQASKAEAGEILGTFCPEKRQAEFATSNFRHADEFRATLRHEVLGHFGINTFTAAEKALVLDALIGARDQPVLHGLWRKIDALYPERNERIRAEEVYAFMCEAIRPERRLDPLANAQSFKEVCIERTGP